MMTAVQIQARAQQLRRRRTAGGGQALPPADLLAGTKIKTPQEEGAASVPFDLWPAQREIVLPAMERESLLVILKARQLGISWMACGYVLWLCTQHPGKTALLFSQGQLEADELIERIAFMYAEHSAKLPALTIENTRELAWENGSGVKSLPATRKAGRSFTASLVIFDEFAFMLFGAQLYAAAKPTIDDGGKLWIISSADGQGTPYHQFWQAAQAGQNGFHPLFLPWTARPSRDAGWRDRKVLEAYGDTAAVLREYPANDLEAFTHASGLVYEGVWSDGPADGNVTEAAAYQEDGGPVYWSCDDGYAGALDPSTRQYTALSHPRVIGLYQLRGDGTLCRFAETYAVGMLSEEQIARTLVLPYAIDLLPPDDRPLIDRAWDYRAAHACYPEPEFVVVDSSAAELRGRLRDADLTNYGGTHTVEEGIKEFRRWLAPDANGRRRLLVHPRCTHFRYEMASYRRGVDGKPIKQHDHGPDECRMLCWKLRYE